MKFLRCSQREPAARILVVSIGLAFLSMLAYGSLYFFLSRFSGKLQPPFFKEYLLYGTVDSLPQIHAFQIVLVMLATLLLTDVCGVLAKKMTGVPIFEMHPTGMWGRHISRFDGSMLVPIGVVLSIGALVAYSVWTLTNQYISSILLNGADPHYYTVFIQTEQMFKTGQSNVSSAYGLLLSAVYYLAASAGLETNYRSAFLLIYSINVLFVVCWTFCVFRIYKATSLPSVFLFILIVVFALGMPLQLLSYAGTINLFPNLSAYRYFPLVIVLLCTLFFSGRSLFAKIVICSLLTPAMIAIAPDMGVISFLGFCGFIVMHDVISFGAIKRVFLFLIASASSFLIVSFLLLSICKADLMGSVAAAFASGTGGYAGLAITLRDPNWIIAAVATTALFYLGTHARTRKLSATEQSCFLMAGMLVVLFAYYFYRPTSLYWIYRAAFVPLTMMLLSEARRLCLPIVQIVLLVVCLPIAKASWAVSSPDTLRMRYVVPVSDQASFGGIWTDASWVAVWRQRESELRSSNISGSEVLPITALPFASIQVSPGFAPPKETLFTFNQPARVSAWINSFCNSPPAAIIFDGRLIGSYLRDISSATELYVQKAIGSHYVETRRTDTFVLWQRKVGFSEISAWACSMHG